MLPPCNRHLFGPTTDVQRLKPQKEGSRTPQLPRLHSVCRIPAAGLAVYHATAASASASQTSYNYATATSRLCGVGAQAAGAANCSGDGSALYTAVTYNDFLLWAAAWGYRATSNASLLADAQAWQQQYIQVEMAAGLG